MKESLKVMLWGKEIGRLAWDKRRGRAYFTYNPAFLSEGLDVSPLVASIKDVRSRMPIWGDDDRRYQISCVGINGIGSEKLCEWINRYLMIKII